MPDRMKRRPKDRNFPIAYRKTACVNYQTNYGGETVQLLLLEYRQYIFFSQWRSLEYTCLSGKFANTYVMLMLDLLKLCKTVCLKVKNIFRVFLWHERINDITGWLLFICIQHSFVSP